MFKCSDRQKLYMYPAFAALCAMGLLLVQYFIRGLYPFGNGSVMITDMYSQYVPLLYRFYDVITGEKNLFLDLSISGGANLYADTINEVLNPFNYVLFLFGRDMIYKAVNVVLLLYVGAAAASINFFLIKVFPNNRKWNLILSLCYAMSGYMAYNYQIIKWMLFPVIFPLFCLALIRLIKDNKGGIYTFLLAYQLVLSIQLGFMTLLFTLFGSGIYFYCCVKREERRELMCRLGVYTLAGLLVSCAALVPNVVILLSSSRADENLSYIGIMKMHGLDDLFERLFQIAHPLFLAFFVWFIIRAGKSTGIGEDGNRNKRKFLVLINVFLWLTVIFQPANLIWHMGSYVCFPVRYAYMAMLTEISLIKFMLIYGNSIEEAEDAKEMGSAKAVEALSSILSVLFCTAACVFTILWNDRIVQAFSTLAISLACRRETIQVCVILLLFFLASLCGMISRYRRQLLLCVSAVCGVCFFMFIMLPQDYEVRILNEEAYRKMTKQAADNDNVSAFHHTKSDPELPPNAPLINRQGSLAGYLPTGNQNFQNTMENLGYLVRWVATQDVGGTAISDRMLSEGILFYAVPSELEIRGGSVLERQEELGKLMLGESCLERIACSETKTNEGAVCLEISGKKTVYLDAAITANSFNVFLNGKEVEVPEADADYGTHRIVELGTLTDEDAEVRITDRGGLPILIETMEIAILDLEKWSEGTAGNGSEYARFLMEQEIDADTSHGSIRVTVDDVEEGSTVFLPVTALSGWNCTINGKKAAVYNVFGFLGIETGEGRNEIILQFIPPGLRFGSILTVLGAVCLAVIIYVERLRQDKYTVSSDMGKESGTVKKTVTKTAEKAVAWIYRILLAGGVITVYIIPTAGLAVYIVMKILKIGG